ncbi:MAG TPA: tetratricopeptide repeat protein [Pseudobdellovibrionaceae bacterium]|nr:tetratricopeptide repeat protein [Pseudobdellovibrionaceae bacterium]
MQIVLIALLFSMKVEAAPLSGSMSFQADTVHAEFEGRPTWNYTLNRKSDGGKKYVELLIDPLDQKSIRSMEGFSSDFVKAVKVVPQGTDARTLVRFELAHDDVEFFDYLTDQPSRLIVDFYVTEAAKKKQATVKPAAKPSKAPAKKKTAAVANQERTPAADTLTVANNGVSVASSNEVKTGLFDGADPQFERFNIKDYEIKEDAVLRARDNDYIPFPMLFSGNEALEQVKQAQPIYEIAPKSGDEENKMARLLLTLFERKRDSVYLKTLTWFREKYPESRYNDLLAYMTGDVHLRKWEENGRLEDYEQAIQAYQEAVRKYPKAPPAERTSLMLGVLAMERGDLISSIRAFEAHIANKEFESKNQFSKDLAKLGSGIAYMKLFRTNEALQAFNDLEKSTSYPDLKADAAYRKGDVYTASKQYVKAIEEYQKAQKNYPAGREAHPGSVFNQGEAMFWTGDHRHALNQFREFVMKFPNDAHAPFAMTRLGEILDVLGADPTRVVGAFLETYFRYGENPRAIVARLRLLSTRMKNMKPKESELAVQEILSLAQKLELPNIEQFATILIADGYTSRGEYPKAIELLTSFYQKNPTSPDLAPLKKRIVSNIAEKMGREVQAGDFIKALKTHQQYADNWLKNTDRLDVQYSLAKSFEMAGVPAESQKIYQGVVNRIHAAKGTPEEKNLRLLRDLPSEESLNLRLAEVANSQKNYQKAYDHLRLIKNPGVMTDEEQVERVELAVRLLENRGDLDSAVRYLTELLKAWQGKPELVARPYSELARLENKMGRKKDAIASLQKIDVLMKDSGGKVSESVHAAALEELGNLQFETGDVQAAAQTYEKLLSTYEDKRPLASIRYRLGRIQFDRGEIQKAANIWNEFKGDKTEFWKNLAQEQLKNSEWREDYKRYIQRIPAMENRE